MADELKVSLGVRTDGTVIHVTELDEATQRGLACRCVCAECGDRLVARLGTVRQHHFAHHSVQDCTRSDESALHRFAKEVFQRHQRFKVPEAEVWWDCESKVISKSLYVPYRRALLEEPMEDIVPDITLIREGKPPFLIEILVTHEVDEVKSAKLQALGLPCIEVDLGGLYCGLDEFDRDAIERLLIHETGYEKDWVCIPNEDTYIEELKEKVRLAEEAEQLRREQERLDAQRRAEWLKRSELKRAATREALLAEEYQAASAAQKEAELTSHPMWRRNSRILGITADRIPCYLNIPLEGEFLFRCHRAIWQTTLFISWVFNKREPDRSRDIHVEFATAQLKEKHPDLLELELYWAWRDKEDVLRVSDLVGRYFSHLEAYGYTRHFRTIGGRNPYSWVFECVRSDVVKPPPEVNTLDYRLGEHGLVNRFTGELADL